MVGREREALLAVCEVDVNLRLGGFRTGNEAPAADCVLGCWSEQSMAGLYFGGRDLAVSLNADEQHDLAADVHAASELRVGGGDARDDGSWGGCGQGGTGAEDEATGEASSEEKRTRGAKWDCQRNLHI